MTSTAWRHETTGGDLGKGLVAGLVGGLAATWVMSMAMAAEQKVERKVKERRRRAQQRAYQHAWSAAGGEGAEHGEPADAGHEQEGSPTEKVAETVSRGVLGHELSDEEKQIAGPVVHYAFGTTMGGLYGLVGEVLPPLTVGFGLPFGAGLWLAADELALPALGLAPPPHRAPVRKQALGFGGHLVYGGVLEGVRCLVRSLL